MRQYDPTHHKMNKLLFGPLLFSIGALLLACNPPTPTPTPTPSATPPHSATSIPEPTPTTAAVQRALAKRGYYKGRIDDKLGPETRRAIREFQSKEGLRASGRVDSATIKKLAP